MNEGIHNIVEHLPRSLRDQVLSYVAAVEAAADAIFDDAHVEQNAQLRQQLLLVAALRKAIGIVSSCYWAVDNSLAVSRGSGASAVRVGGAIYSKESERYLELRQLHKDLNAVIDELGLRQVFEADNYTDVLTELAHGRE
ncbi:hypothetical protein JM946_20520 [Steroidobacter sp. S1-65]|uniref:Uncharacterized protein n=1 Tax=Steroidobacter gossypii TaxID=2805490 RepID=A0ABS1X1T4_9GAMM|nr:hypothetical protein [Steroidobacter gossypii]MBM0107127.1 hypothetical protein [Steroidobacter gossypii]